jgi:diaminohydroxyphosphoribosylaminopyrimidine deaminase/5-amino-6-(5-phosphoribosylamino)uracil reductase
MSEEEKYMNRALQIAALGRGFVAPNPLVGCVIVKDGQIIGEGWHKKYGEGHAEVNAVNSVTDKANIAGSIIYVSLEPCSHHGKTPPCADLLVSLQPQKVVVSNIDSNPLVSGGGIKKLVDAGIEVVTEVLNEEARQLNIRFFTFMEKKRPYVILKWAQTADQFVARANYDSKWISNLHSRKLTHKWRSEEAAILVGYKTALHDDPRLTTRDWIGNNPIRIVLDSIAELPASLKIFDNSAPTIRISLEENAKYDEGNNHSIVQMNAETILSKIYELNIQSVLVEGGSATLQKFIDAELWDEARVFTAPQVFGAGIKAPVINATPHYQIDIFGDTLHHYFKN